MSDLKVTTFTSRRRDGKWDRKTEDLETWLGEVLNSPHLEVREVQVRKFLVRLVRTLAEKDLLSVQEVVDAAEEYNCFPADAVPSHLAEDDE